jgi:hypothetical protein
MLCENLINTEAFIIEVTDELGCYCPELLVVPVGSFVLRMYVMKALCSEDLPPRGEPQWERPLRIDPVQTC